ncbi:hypothetical protein SBOR_4178 [Sclerotinia borealis F-4128]|uniref:Uncharacterized protein n=1 Tax=Sclerotinia borealis (strain F-4128) TaxID=1432307 RepID=W9CFC1_SCLBF|nr:hypothetical protein SBOR_4178 [Sclerotinia borealis F-4128]
MATPSSTPTPVSSLTAVTSPENAFPQLSDSAAVSPNRRSWRSIIESIRSTSSNEVSHDSSERITASHEERGFARQIWADRIESAAGGSEFSGDDASSSEKS